MFVVTGHTPTTELYASCQTLDDARKYYWDQRFMSKNMLDLGLWSLDPVVGWQLIHGCSRPTAQSSWQDVQRQGELASPLELQQQADWHQDEYHHYAPDNY